MIYMYKRIYPMDSDPIPMSNDIKLAQYTTAVTPVRQQWSYYSVALSHRYKQYTQVPMHSFRTAIFCLVMNLSC